MLTEPFVLRGLIASVIMASLCGPIGCLMIWRNMAYFSDTLSHSALTGVLLGLVLGIGDNAGVTIVVCLTALILTRLHHRNGVDNNIFLLISGQTALCLGIIGLSLMPDVRTDITAYLFGDVLSVSDGDLAFITLIACLCVLLIVLSWKKQIFIVVMPDVAHSEGINVGLHSVIFMILTALFISSGMKTTGLLLISALLIIPAATARFFSKTPEMMAFSASLIGIFCVMTGFASSLYFDLPAGATMVVFCSVLFLICHLIRSFIQ